MLQLVNSIVCDTYAKQASQDMQLMHAILCFQCSGWWQLNQKWLYHGSSALTMVEVLLSYANVLLQAQQSVTMIEYGYTVDGGL